MPNVTNVKSEYCIVFKVNVTYMSKLVGSGGAEYARDKESFAQDMKDKKQESPGPQDASTLSSLSSFDGMDAKLSSPEATPPKPSSPEATLPKPSSPEAAEKPPVDTHEKPEEPPLKKRKIPWWESAEPGPAHSIPIVRNPDPAPTKLDVDKPEAVSSAPAAVDAATIPSVEKSTKVSEKTGDVQAPKTAETVSMKIGNSGDDVVQPSSSTAASSAAAQPSPPPANMAINAATSSAAGEKPDKSGQLVPFDGLGDAGPAPEDAPQEKIVTDNFFEQDALKLADEPAKASQREAFMKADLIMPGIALKKFKMALADDAARSQSYLGVCGVDDFTMYKTKRKRATGLCMGAFTPNPEQFWNLAAPHLRNKPLAALLVFEDFQATIEDATQLT